MDNLRPDGMRPDEKQPKVIQCSWFDSNFYLIQEKDKEEIFIPSVTTKLGASPKPFLAKWRGDIGNREADLLMNEAANKGKRIHSAWYVYNTRGWVLYNPFERPNYTADEIAEIKSNNMCTSLAILSVQEEMYHIFKLEQWVKIVKPTFIESEKIVYSLKTMNAGTMDNCLFIEAGSYMINGAKPVNLPKGYFVFDLKTGNSIDEDDAPAQAAIYAHMYSEMTGIEIVGTLIVHTNAKTKTGVEGLATLYRNKEEMKLDLEYFFDVCKVWDRKLSGKKPKFFKFPSLIKL